MTERMTLCLSEKDVMTTLQQLLSVVTKYPHHVSLSFTAAGLLCRVELHEVPGPLWVLYQLQGEIPKELAVDEGDRLNIEFRVDCDASAGEVPVSLADYQRISRALADACSA